MQKVHCFCLHVYKHLLCLLLPQQWDPPFHGNNLHSSFAKNALGRSWGGGNPTVPRKIPPHALRILLSLLPTRREASSSSSVGRSILLLLLRSSVRPSAAHCTKVPFQRRTKPIPTPRAQTLISRKRRPGPATARDRLDRPETRHRNAQQQAAPAEG